MIWRALLSLLLAPFALAASWLAGRKSAQADIKVEGLEDAVKGHELRNEVENRIAVERDAKRRLHDDWQR